MTLALDIMETRMGRRARLLCAQYGLEWFNCYKVIVVGKKKRRGEGEVAQITALVVD